MSARFLTKFTETAELTGSLSTAHKMLHNSPLKRVLKVLNRFQIGGGGGRGVGGRRRGGGGGGGGGTHSVL